MPSAPPAASFEPEGALLRPVSFADLPGYDGDDHLAAFAAYLRTAEVIASAGPELRSALPTPPALRAVCKRALAAEVETADQARRFFEAHFTPCRIETGEDPPAFLTGYYEPVVPG